MPRTYSDLPDSSVTTDTPPDHAIPDLTYDNARELLPETDYIMVSFGATPAAQKDYDIHHSNVPSHRIRYLWREFVDRFQSEFISEHSWGTTKRFGKARHAKLNVSNPNLFDELEQFIEETVPLWSYVAISYCWADHAHPRANTLLYQLTDRMPPHPETQGLHKPGEQLTDEEIEEYMEIQEEHFDYDESETPRFEYGPTHVMNGDYDAAGADITAYAWDEFKIDIRFDKRDDETPTVVFPSTYSTPFYDDIMDFVEEYPNHLSITEIAGHQTEVTTDDIPVPLLPNVK